MDIYILTHGRVNRQTTYDNLPPHWQEQATFVIQERELPIWKEQRPKTLAHQVLVLPDRIRNLHQTRQWLLDHYYESYPVVEMDDDVVFSARRNDDPTKFRPMEDDDFDTMFEDMELNLKDYPMAGVVAREGANRQTQDYLYATRQMRVHAFRPAVLKNLDLRWDLLRSPGPEDFCMLLQLLTNGIQNVVLNNYCQNQGGSNTSGGVSEYRTLDVHADACEHLAELFPKYVTVVEKETKGSWGGGTRKDVRIQWKKAYKDATNGS